MAYFIVSYDLRENRGEERYYGDIEKALEKLDSCHTHDSVWYVERSGTAEQLYNHLKPKFEERDRLLVVEFSKKPARQKGKDGTTDWINKRFI
jgi:hypothetical protein